MTEPTKIRIDGTPYLARSLPDGGLVAFFDCANQHLITAFSPSAATELALGDKLRATFDVANPEGPLVVGVLDYAEPVQVARLMAPRVLVDLVFCRALVAKPSPRASTIVKAVAASVVSSLALAVTALLAAAEANAQADSRDDVAAAHRTGGTLTLPSARKKFKAASDAHLSLEALGKELHRVVKNSAEAHAVSEDLGKTEWSKATRIDEHLVEAIERLAPSPEAAKIALAVDYKDWWPKLTANPHEFADQVAAVRAATTPVGWLSELPAAALALGYEEWRDAALY